ncbi:hypothetical protein C8A05DRAFT_20125, partial [Staphylotrichum tortipilum]
RDSTVWYPAIPPQGLCLNEKAFPLRAFHLAGYRPLFWCHFGGPGGRYLRHPTGISAVSCLGILRIYFSFDIQVPVEHRSCRRLKVDEQEKVVNFSIDGQRIETVKMHHYYPPKTHALPRLVREGSMVRCELFTNRGKSCAILPHVNYTTGVVDAEVRAAPGMGITGLYGTERPEEGDDIAAMGVITEDVSDVDDTES